MKNIYFTLICFLVTFTMKSQIVQIPYFEDFESFSCSSGNSTTCVLNDTLWHNDTLDDIDWIVNSGSTSSSNTGPYFDHTYNTCGSTGQYLYVECSSPGFPFKQANLLSPQIDLSGTNNVQMEFWWHMFGATMGVFHLDLSTDFGSTWNNDIIPSWSITNSSEWVKTVVDLGSYVNDTIIIRFRFISGTSYASDFAIDDVSIYEKLNIDAGVSELVNPVSVLCDSLSDIWVKVKNYGIDTLTSVQLNYSVNGSVSFAPHTWTGSLLPSYDTTVMIGTHVFSNGDTLEVWTSQPNNTTELPFGSYNDTIISSLTMVNGMSGDYFLGGPNADFNSFTEAINALDSLGVCGPVNILVNDSIYNEQITINDIISSNYTNTITFKSISGNNLLSGIHFDGSNSNDNYVVKIESPNIFRFKNLKLSNFGTTYGRVFHINYNNLLAFSGTNLIIDSCYIEGDTTSSSTSSFRSLIYKYNSFSSLGCTYSFSNYSGFLITNNEFHGGSYAIYASGSSNLTDTNFQIKNNQFIDYSRQGIYLSYVNEIEISDNTFIPDSSSYLYCEDINVRYVSGPSQINNNKIYAYNTNSDNIHVYAYNNQNISQYDTLKIFNNFICQFESSSNNSIAQGIYLQNSHVVFVANNTLNFNNPNASSICLRSSYSDEVHLYNNNFNNSGDNGIAYNLNDPFEISESNYNNFNLQNSNGFNVGNNQMNFLNFQSNYSLDSNSYTTDPMFSSNDDWHTCNDTLDMVGTPLYFVTHDLDGDPRFNTPDIGADEFFGLSKFSLGNDQTICFLDSILLGSESDLASYSWSTGAVSSSINVPSGTYSVVANGTCGTTSDTIVIDNFPEAVADFTATPSYLTLICSNNSLNYDSLFWDFGDGNTSNIDSPIHVYDSIGTYVVLLTVYNQCGSDTMSVVFSTNLGLNENDLFSDFNVYPNPNNGSFNLEASLLAPNNISVTLTNVLGQVVYTKDLGFINNSDLNHFVQLDKSQKGLFFVSLVSGDTRNVKIVNIQ